MVNGAGQGLHTPYCILLVIDKCLVQGLPFFKGKGVVCVSIAKYQARQLNYLPAQFVLSAQSLNDKIIQASDVNGQGTKGIQTRMRVFWTLREAMKHIIVTFSMLTEMSNSVSSFSDTL